MASQRFPGKENVKMASYAMIGLTYTITRRWLVQVQIFQTMGKECMSVWSSHMGTGSIVWLRPEWLKFHLHFTLSFIILVFETPYSLGISSDFPWRWYGCFLVNRTTIQLTHLRKVQRPYWGRGDTYTVSAVWSSSLSRRSPHRWPNISFTFNLNQMSLLQGWECRWSC